MSKNRIREFTISSFLAPSIKIYDKGRYMQDMHSAGFYSFPDEESYWGLWPHLALLSGVDMDVTLLHKTLINVLADKKTFVLSTNVDAYALTYSEGGKLF